MSDDQQWQAPESPAAPLPSPGSAPPPVPPGSVPSGSGAAGWAPVPKPGLIPLRPIDFGTLLGASFLLLRRNPKPTFGAALLIQTISTVLTVAIIGAVTFFAVARTSSSSEADLDLINAGNTGLIVLGVLVSVAISVVASAMLQGIVSVEITRQTLGEKSTFRRLWARVKGRIGALVAWSVLVGLAVVLAIAVLAGLIALLVLTLGVAGIVLAVLLGIVGGLGLLVLFAWLGTKLSLAPSIVSIERLGIVAAARRSWSLTARSFWRTLGIELLVLVMINIATQVISLPLGLVSGLTGVLLDPNGQDTATTSAVLIGITVITLAVTLVVGAVTVVVQSGSTALIYLDLRIRKEALDLELIRYTEALHSGDGSVADPFPGPAAA